MRSIEQVAREVRIIRDQGVESVEEILRIGRLLNSHVDERLEDVPNSLVEGHRGLEARRTTLRQVLGEVREVGSERLHVRSGGAHSRPAAQDLAGLAEEFYPADWIRASNERSAVRVGTRRILFHLFTLTPAVVGVTMFLLGVLGCLTVVLGIGWPIVGLAGWLAVAASVVLALVAGAGGAWLMRSSYRAWQEMGSEIFGAYYPVGAGLFSLSPGTASRQDWHGLLVHELFHRFEHVVHGLKSAEYDFRAGRGGKSKHAWFHWYAGSRSLTGLEVLTQAYQAMTFGISSPDTKQLDPDLQPDPEHQAFVLGVLACF